MADDPDEGLPRTAADLDTADDCVIAQGWKHYSDLDHAIWRRLFERQSKLLPGRACAEYLAGLEGPGVAAGEIPDFERLSDILERATGWRIVAVPGLVPDDVFFAHLAARRFPATNWIRRPEQMDYLWEPDIFHDIFGHVPVLMNPAFADYMAAYGRGGARGRDTCGPTGSSVGWVVGSVCRRSLTPAALIEPIAVAVHLEDIDVMGEAVEERAGQAFEAEHLGPFVEWQVGGDQGGAAFIALAEHLEQQLGAGLGQRHEAEFVDDQKLVGGELSLEPQQLLVIARLDELVDQGGGGDEADRGALLAGRQAETEGNVGLAGVGDSSCAVIAPPGLYAALTFIPRLRRSWFPATQNAPARSRRPPWLEARFSGLAQQHSAWQTWHIFRFDDGNPLAEAAGPSHLRTFISS